MRSDLLRHDILLSSRRAQVSGAVAEEAINDFRAQAGEDYTTWEGWAELRNHGKPKPAEGTLQAQFEKRRAVNVSKFSRMLAEIDILEFMADDDSEATQEVSGADLQVIGAIPPVTDVRVIDVVGNAAAVHHDRKVAEKQISDRKRHDAAKVKRRAQRIRQEIALAHASYPTASEPLRELLPCTPCPQSADEAQELTGSEDEVSTEAGTSCFGEMSRNSTPMPSGKAFEATVAAFHREVERKNDYEQAAYQLQKQKEDQEAHAKHVMRQRFERNHRRREAEIANEVKRREARANFEAQRETEIIEVLLKRDREERDAKQRLKDSIRQQKALREARKQQRETLKSFALRQRSLEQGCRKGDTEMWRNMRSMHESIVQEQRNITFQRRSQMLENRKKLCDAQRQANDYEDRRRIEYALRRRRLEDQDDFYRRQEAIQVQKEVQAAVRAVRKQLAASTSRSRGTPQAEVALAAAADPHGLSSYRETLDAFAEMAEGVRNTSLQLAELAMEVHEDEQELEEDEYLEDDYAEGHQQETEEALEPLSQLEHRVRKIFQDSHAPWYLSEERSQAASHSAPSITDRSSPTSSPGCRLPVVNVPKIAFEVLTQPSRDERRPPLSARHLVSLAEQVSGTLPTRIEQTITTSARAKAEVRGLSLSALRRVRRTGDFSSRGV